MENGVNHIVERLLDTPYWDIDWLPMLVPQDSQVAVLRRGAVLFERPAA